MKIRFLRASYFIWVIILVAVGLIYQTYGLPHMIWSYDFRNNGQGYDPFADRYYTRCTYIGPYGSFTDRFPQNGSCDWFQLHKSSGGGS